MKYLKMIIILIKMNILNIIRKYIEKNNIAFKIKYELKITL